MYSEAYRRLCGFWDDLFFEGPEDTDDDDELESDGFRDMALDEEANPCDSEDVEEDGIE